MGSLLGSSSLQNSPFAARSGQKPASPDRSGSPQENESPEADEDAKPEILCRQCRQGVTDPEQRITAQGGHRHTFANPHGIVFEIGCFREVRNCGMLGAPTAEFSWFPGFRWQIVICGTCLTHLGWLFTAGGPEHFFGLILDRLVIPD
ncbi:MAG: hypothetical protein K9K88_09390 [Desulfobacterales bacterium]|nr:hypothetical protein [Desulfobacterales bacterium]